MVTRRFTRLDVMALLAAVACGLGAGGCQLRRLASELGDVGSAALGPISIRGRSTDDLSRDPRVNWALYDATGAA
jgi:hypothetical protein